MKTLIFVMLFFGGSQNAKISYTGGEITAKTAVPVVVAQLTVEEWLGNVYQIEYQTDWIFFGGQPAVIQAYSEKPRIRVTLNYTLMTGETQTLVKEFGKTPSWSNQEK